MRVLVTGGTGSVGGRTVERLLSLGHSVRVIGRRAGIAIPGAEYAVCDINDYEALREQVRGMEGIIHLAAIPHPAMGPGQEIFRVNASGTYNVYEAAADEGIRRVVTASSINAFGYNFGIQPFPLRYYPVDEEHPTYTTDPYSFSKQVTEAIADYYWRREGISGVCLRLPAVLNYAEEPNSWFIRIGRETRAYVQELLALAPAERQARVAELIRLYDTLRSERAFERRRSRELMQRREVQIAMGRSNFWAAIDDRDSAQALEKGLTAAYEGSHPLFVNDCYNAAAVEARTLVELFFPEGPEWRGPAEGKGTLVSIDAARELIGYEPEYHPIG